MEVEVEEMRMQMQMQMIVDSVVELSWEFDVEDLSRSYSFLRAPEDRKKEQGCIMQHSGKIWIMYVPPSQGSQGRQASLVQPQNGSQTEELPAIRAT